MSISQADKAQKFRALHEAPGAFVIANPWDGGSARLLAGLGFQALATSSGAKAGVLGKRDGKVTREEALANAKMIVEACDLPVAADPVFDLLYPEPDATLEARHSREEASHEQPLPAPACPGDPAWPPPPPVPPPSL